MVQVRIMLRLRYIIKALLVILLCAGLVRAQQTPRLVFTKSTPMTKDKMLRRHVVVRGEHLYMILRSYGILNEDLKRVAEYMAELNPGIADLNVLSPGQAIVIPLSADIASKSAKGQGTITPSANQTRNATAQTRNATLPGGQISHVVGSGETIVKILRGMGLPDAMIFNEYLNKARSLNPDLGNLNNLSAGQQVILPLPSSTVAQPTVTPAPLSVQEKNKKTQNATENATLPESTMHFVQSVNATGPDKPEAGKSGGAASGGSGAEVGKLAATATASTSVSATPTPEKFQAREEDETSPKAITPSERDMLHKSVVLSLLRTLGFWSAPGQEVLYPAGEGRWLRLQLTRTPMLTAPWGRNLVLVPPDSFSATERQQVERMGIALCPVPQEWTPREVLRLVAEKSSGVMNLWSGDRSLILNSEGVVFELSGDHVVQIRSGNQRGFYILNLIAPGDRRVPNLVQAFLARHSITLAEWELSPTGLNSVGGTWPGLNSLIVSEVSSASAWDTIRPRLTQSGQSLSVSGQDIESVLASLRKAGLARDVMLKLGWFEDGRRSMRIRVPAIEIQGVRTFYLVRPAQADPYLMAVLALEGHDCLVIR